MIVIPMAGLSSRFLKAGYSSPKYMLKAHGKTLFHHTVSSFEPFFGNKVFVFIVRDLLNTKEFVEFEAKNLGIKKYHICILPSETRGQAETVYEGIKLLSKSIKIDMEDSLTIFNIDTIRRNFHYPENDSIEDGYLEVFDGKGNNWSFVKPANTNSTRVLKTTEKDPISSLCCTGLYYFSKVSDYFKSFESYIKLPRDEWEKGELYVAPLYNVLIQQGKKIHYHEILSSDVIFSGVPEEYIEFCNKGNSFNK